MVKILKKRPLIFQKTYIIFLKNYIDAPWKMPDLMMMVHGVSHHSTGATSGPVDATITAN